jgi:hypothetical protein
MPLVELARSPIYKKKITKEINFSNAESQDDVINLQNEKPTFMFGPHIENSKNYVSPFYIALNVHDHLLHNCMLDSRSSHNLMPNIIMEKFGLEITRTYQDLYSFDSRKVKCLGMIKYLVVNLAQVPVKSILMDVVIVDVPSKSCLAELMFPPSILNKNFKEKYKCYRRDVENSLRWCFIRRRSKSWSFICGTRR